jgi:tetratricopeptide (TPR) repeat protein
MAGLVCLPLAFGMIGCGVIDKLKARDHLNKGVRAFREAEYERAVGRFQQAIELDPEFLNAQIYLATSYASLYIPNGQSEENIRVGEEAISAYERVLEQDPGNLYSVKGIAGIYFNMGQFQKAKEYYLKHCEMEPDNATPFYSVGNVNWTMAYDKLTPRPAQERWDLSEEGLEYLERALVNDPDYFNAHFYINLLNREKGKVLIDEIVQEKPSAENEFILAGQDLNTLEPLVKKHGAERYEEYVGYHKLADEHFELAMAIKRRVEEESAAAAIGVIEEE